MVAQAGDAHVLEQGNGLRPGGSRAGRQLGVCKRHLQVEAMGLLVHSLCGVRNEESRMTAQVLTEQSGA